MLPNPWTFLAKRCPVVTRLVLLPLVLLGILGFLINTHLSFLTTSLEMCFSKTNIVFLKTHKCAGSSIQNILMRYGDTHRLTFVLPKSGNYLGHPAPFSRAMVAAPRLHSYNILAHHTRLDYFQIHALMPKNSVFITIVRKPIEVFESAYSYYTLGRFVGGSLNAFLRKLPTINRTLWHRRVKGKFGSNQMLFDLGADPDIFNNDTLVKAYINKLDSWFDLVLIADRMDESLVLLRHHLCWDLNDVITFKLNARDPRFRSRLSMKEKSILTELNHADALLYNHFLKKFEQAIDDFGRERMTAEMQQLRERTKEWYNVCIKKEERHEAPTAKPKYYYNPKVLYFKPTSESNDTCKSMTMEELPYTDILRKRQQKLVKTNASIAVRRRTSYSQNKA